VKKRNIRNKIDFHYSNVLYARLTRRKGGFEGLSHGFIVKKSDNFILLQETNDFRILGYQIIPINSIKKLRFNKNDKTINKILKAEGQLPSLKHDIDLTDWKTIFKDIKATNLTAISECEHPKHNYFCIGKISRVKKNSVLIKYFNAQGIVDKKNTEHKFQDITKVSFDDHYANVFSKYLIEK